MIAKTPPMGWNSWDCYGAAVDEKTVRQNADYMAKHLKKFGWEYIVVDIQWYQPTADSHDYQPFAELTMDDYGRLLPAVNRFPSAAGGAGFGPLAEYVHGLGLKFGIHIMRGLPRMAAHRRLPIYGSRATCAQAANPNSVCDWNPDMYGLRCELPEARAYYDSIFALYADWGVDYVKVDDIAREYPHCRREIEVISEACRGCGRDMVLSLSPGPAPLEQAEHLKRYANMWRLTDDFWDRWPLLKAMFERAEKWCVHAGPGHWPDLDMLPAGAVRQVESPENWTRFTREELRTMMTLWCIMPAPLMFGGEMTKLDDFTRRLITNEAVLEMLKDTFGGRPVYTREEEAAWMAPRRDGQGCYVALFNLSDEARTLTLSPETLGLAPNAATELWTGEPADPGLLSARLSAHDAAVWLVR
ncbi:MAG: glycoside hydrolase family 27 protein [Eubacteriales bacterium]|nr:glycoside hydrolase family 27 protein [Eubacteriales bacterium]